MLDNNNTYITKEKLKEILKLQEKGFNNFYNKLINNNLLIEQNKTLCINKEYFNNILENKYIKIYRKPTRELYNSINQRTQKRVAYIYKLLPYLNTKFNVLCQNTEEKNINQVILLKPKEVSDILGIESSGSSRFIKGLYSLKIDEYQVIKEYEGALYINPLLYYNGEDSDVLIKLVDIFKI